MEGNQEFLNYTVKINKYDVHGSYDIYDDQDTCVGKSTGFTVRKRYISFHSILSGSKYMISKGDKNIYYIIKEDNIESTLQTQGFIKPLTLSCKDETIYTMHPFDLNTVYRINSNKKNVGIISCKDWIFDDVGLSIKETDNIDYILGAIISIGYHKNSSPWAMFHSKS